MISNWRKKSRQSSADEPMDDTPAPNPVQNSAPGPKLKVPRRNIYLPLEIQEMEGILPSTCHFSIPNKNDLSRLILVVRPSRESLWYGGSFRFVIDVPDEYKYVAPKVRCETGIYHPNIAETGEVCLSILRVALDERGWLPTRSIKEVVFGLDALFTDLLNFDDPLNVQAAECFHREPRIFHQRVKEYIRRYCN